MSLFYRKPISMFGNSPLRRCLDLADLIFLGLGAVIGAGVFILTGIAAATKAGPAVILSYAIAGSAALFAGLAYAELAASINGTGGTYDYAYAGFGQLIAWIIGWDLLLEYSLCISTVAIGWSSYINNILLAWGIHLPSYLLNPPIKGGIINLPATLIILLIASLLIIGIKQSAKFNETIVLIKLLAIATFITVACKHINIHHWQNFMPFHWHGVMQGASLVFFAYIGFEALATTSSECIRPQRDLPISIIVTIVLCASIYLAVAALLTLIVPYASLNTGSPVAETLLALGHPYAASLVAAGAVAGLTTVILVMSYALTRICLSMANDKLLPRFLTKINPKTQTPVTIIAIIGLLCALIAGLTPITELAELVNIGTLAAFSLACIGVIVLRYREPHTPRPFKLPLHPLFPLLGIVCCLYLMLQLPFITWLRFLVWLGIGVVIYFTYSQKKARHD